MRVECNEKNISLLIDVLKKCNGNVSVCCKAVGICRKTFYNWKDKSAELQEAYSSIELDVIDKVEESLYQNAMNGHFGSQVFILKNRRRDKWQDVKEIKTTVTSSLEGKSIEELDEIIAELEAKRDSELEDNQDGE